MEPKAIVGWVVAVVLVLVCGGVGTCACTTIEPGHVGVAVNFGKPQPETYDAGTHFTNPLYDWVIYDCREKTHAENDIEVPSGDQLTSRVDVSVQFRADRTMCHRMLGETGALDAVVATHLVPKLRSLMREQGKGLARAEDFFSEDVQQRMQVALSSELGAFLTPKGLIVEAVLIRDVTLPQTIVAAIQSRKEREQQAEQQKVELGRYRTEQEQKVALAKAELEAAEAEAAKMVTMANARASEIRAQGAALRENPDVLRWESIKRWDGVLPRVMSGDAGVLLNLGIDKP